jgi:hypothetical protein
MQSATALTGKDYFHALHGVFCKLNNEILAMDKKAKSKIYQLVENINDEAVLAQVMENIIFYTNRNDIVDTLDAKQLKELDKAIEEADKGEMISWSDFKKELNEWEKNNP